MFLYFVSSQFCLIPALDPWCLGANQPITSLWFHFSSDHVNSA